MSSESERDRQAILADHDRASLPACGELRCLFTDPAGEAGETVGTAPTATLSVGDVERVPIKVGTRIETIRRYDGRSEGPFRVAVLRRLGGGFVECGLERLAS